MPTVPDSKRDPKTPPEVNVTLQPREPVSDPTLGIPVPKDSTQATYRLVAVGDSLTHGFQSGAIYNTDLSYPAIIAWEMGWYDQFHRPQYLGFGGLPINVEFLIRDLEAKFGESINIWELPLAYFAARHHLAEAEAWWEHGPGSIEPNLGYFLDNLGIYGWDLRDALSFTADVAHRRIKSPKDSFLVPLIANANERAALRVLPNTPGSTDLATLQTAGKLSQDGSGIETLIVMLGANNALGTVTQLRVCWSEDADYDNVDKKDRYTIWNPKHFKAELDLVEAEVKKIRAKHVIWVTVPHVTIAPVARGIARKVEEGSRYFPYYTRPWINDSQFDPNDDPNITENQARAIDSAIDQYNDSIVEVVRKARITKRDWYVFDIAGVLDRLACRRYIDDHAARPDWWTKYELPPELMALNPVPDSRFFAAGTKWRTAGGLFSLDGIHPTTIAYGLIAQELINIMELAGVQFFLGDGVTRRSRPVRVDFSRLVARDTLISNPPKSLSSDLKLIGWLDEVLDIFKRLFR